MCILTPGSSEVQPRNAYERGFAVILLVVSLYVFPAMVGNITTTMSSIDGKKRALLKQKWSLRRYLNRNNVSPALAKSIMSHVQFVVLQNERNIDPSSVPI